MDDFVGDILMRVDESGVEFAKSAYGSISQQIEPLLSLMAIIYVAVYGIQMAIGASSISLLEILNKTIRMVFITYLIHNWVLFDKLLYEWISYTPKAVETILLTQKNTDVQGITVGLSQVWRIANQAAGAFASQTGWDAVLPSLVGFVIMVAALIFIALAISILLLSKIIMWTLIGLAPIFIVCLLYERSRGIGYKWFEQILLYALLPLLVYVFCAFMIIAIRPEMDLVFDSIANNAIDLKQVAGFVTLCTAGAFALMNIFQLSQKIVSGVTWGILTLSTKISQLRMMSGSLNTRGDGSLESDNTEGTRVRYNFISHRKTSLVNENVKETMQNRIMSSNVPW